MKKKHKFVPDQVASMEDRALMSGFGRMAAFHGSSTLGYSGALVLTNRTFQNLQRSIDTTIQQFNRTAMTLFNRQGFSDAFYARLGVGTYGMGPNEWSYARGTALAGVDSRMASLEFKLPYGGGLGNFNPTGGSGLSNRTALSSRNPGLGQTGYLSVAESLDNAIQSSTNGQELRANLEYVRLQTLGRGGVLPSYVAAFGPRGEGNFGVK